VTIQGQAIRSLMPAEADALPDSIAFLARYGLAVESLAQAARIARDCGVEPDEALLRCGLGDEDVIYRALALETGLPFLSGDLAVHPMARFPAACLEGIVPLADGHEGQAFGYAPQGERWTDLVANKRPLAPGLAIITPSALRRSMLRARGDTIAAQAADTLPREAPHLSAREGLSFAQCSVGLAALLLLGLGFVLWPRATWQGLTGSIGLVFLGVTALRLAAIVEFISPHTPSLPRPRDDALPVYTVLVPLYREVRVFPRLLAALARLDYPHAKLDVKFVVEADDAEMALCLAATDLPGWAEVIVAPPGLPRTKPRALNVALPLARGEFVTIYDAEDVPEPGQLRLAVATFLRVPSDVACLQARLLIDNTKDTVEAGLFTLEYAALFDELNPALARFDMPIPLGGTSNHFRTAIVQGLGGWDAWNVTEDADLGIRLAAKGYRVADLPSATHEETPKNWPAWIKQRRRWMKGFLQVSITHSRQPLRLFRQLGAARFFGAAAMSFGTVGSALGFPFFLALAIHDIAAGDLLRATEPMEIVCASIGSTLFAAGFLAMVLPPLEAIRRRRFWKLLPFVPLMPFYYLLISWAAWRGLVDLVVDPHRWLKTDHGHARTSRSGLVDLTGA
jgi:cellulose synthase/poly-beta-1,6-N-acetylglucosamine synthase-like glycosyltransferase